MTSNQNSHLVIIPTYNEIDNIPDFISEISKFNVSVLFVDDSSPDGTGDLISKTSKSNVQINLLNRPSKQGLGSAYRDGFTWGIEKGYDFFIEMDADFSHSFVDLEKIIEASSNFDLIIGSRYIKGGGSEGWDFKRKLLSKFGLEKSKDFHYDNLVSNIKNLYENILWKTKFFDFQKK